MDSMLTFDLLPYRLILQREPFALIIERGAQRLLQTTPHAEPITGWQLHEQAARVTFPDSTLSITIADMALHLHWQSAHRQRLAFTNYGYWYGQGGLIHQRWPLDRVMQSMTELLTCDNGPTGLLCIQTPAWLS